MWECNHVESLEQDREQEKGGNFLVAVEVRGLFFYLFFSSFLVVEWQCCRHASFSSYPLFHPPPPWFLSNPAPTKAHIVWATLCEEHAVNCFSAREDVGPGFLVCVCGGCEGLGPRDWGIRRRNNNEDGCG